MGDSIGLFFWSARMPKRFKIIVAVCVVLIGGQVATAQQTLPHPPTPSRRSSRPFIKAQCDRTGTRQPVSVNGITSQLSFTF
jgi:hypothetical protein